ncbi:MAG: beta strand repeat-containing protein, partial [Planctomyces sp.]
MQAAINTAIAAAAGATITVTYWSGTELQVRFGGTLAGTDIQQMTGTATSSVTPAVLTQTTEGFNQLAIPDSSQVLVVDYSSNQLSVTTGTNSSITLTHDGARGELTEVSGQLHIAVLNNTVVLDGSVAMKLSSQQIEVRTVQGNYTTVPANAIEIGAYGSVSVSVGGEIARLSGVTMAMAYYTPQPAGNGDTRSWLGIKTSGGTVQTGSNVGTVGASDVVVGLNKGYGDLNSSPNATVVDFRKTFESSPGLNDGFLDIDTGRLDTVQRQPITVRIDFDRELVSMSATVELSVADFFFTQGTFTYTNTTDSISLVGSTSQIAVTARILSVTGASVFVGSDYHLTGSTTINPDRQGFDLTGVNFYYVTMTETGGQGRVWTALRATAASGAMLGFADFSISTTNLAIQLNSAASDHSIIQSATSQYGTGPLAVTFGAELRQLTGTATLNIAGALQIHGGFAFSQSSTPSSITLSNNATQKSARVTTFAFDGLSAFFGDGPYFVDSTGDGLIDSSDTPSASASGLLLSNGRLAVAYFTPVSTTDTARYYAVQASLAAISLPGLVDLSNDTTFALTASGYRIEFNGGNTAANGDAVNFARSYETASNARDGALQVATSPNTSATFNYTSSMQRVAIEHAMLRIADYVYASGGFAVTRQQMSVKLSDALHTTVSVNALTFGAGNVNLFVGSGPYFEDTDQNGRIDTSDTPNSDAVGLAIENANFAFMMMSRTSGGGTGPKYKALKATASRIGLVGIDNVVLSATGLKVEYNAVSNPNDSNDSTVVDFTQLAGGRYVADTGAGTLTFDYSLSRLMAEVSEAELRIESNVFIRGGLAFTRIAPQMVTLSNGGQKEVSGFALGASGVTVFAGTNGPYWLDATGQQINSQAAGVSLQNTSLAMTVLRPVATTDKSRYTSLKARSSFFGFVGIDAFDLQASAIAVDLNTVSGAGSSSTSPVIDFNSTFNSQWAQNIVFDVNNNGIVTVGELRARSGLSSFSSGTHVLYTVAAADSEPISYSALLAALDTGDGTSNTPDGLLQVTEVTAFLSSTFDSLAGNADTDNDGKLEIGYGFSTGGGAEFLRETDRRTRASADDVLLKISKFVFVNGNVAIDLGRREVATVNTGIPASVAAIMGSSTLQTLRSALTGYSTTLNNTKADINTAFESLVNSVQARVTTLCADIADEMLNPLYSGVETLQTAVRNLASNALTTVSSGITSTFLQPVLNTLTGTFLNTATSEPLRSVVQSVITDPLERLLTAAFQEFVEQALSDSVGPLVAGVSDALQAISDTIGLQTAQIKAAIVASLQPQLLVIRAKLDGLKTSLESRLAPVLDRLNQVAQIEIGDDFSTISGIEVEVTTVGVSNARAFIGSQPAAGFQRTVPLNSQGAIGIYATAFNLAFGMFKPTLSQSLPGFTAAKMTIGDAGFTDGGANVLTFSMENVDVQVNTGKPLISLGGALKNATINFPLSFPADNSGQVGYAVATGTYARPTYLDFTNEVIEASVGNVTLGVSEFIYLTGSLAFKKGGAQTVHVTEGLASSIVQAGSTALGLNFPPGLNVPATGATTTEVEFLTIGAADLTGFVGVGGPYRTNTKYKLQISEFSGNLNLSFAGPSSSLPVNSNDSDATLRTGLVNSLIALGIPQADVRVTGGRQYGFTIEFLGGHAGTDVAGLQVSTGGVSGVSITKTSTGT